MDILNTLVGEIVKGGPGAIIGILLAIIAGMGYVIKKLHDANNKKDEKIEKIFDDYHKGNLTMVETLNGLKMVLVEIKAKI